MNALVTGVGVTLALGVIAGALFFRSQLPRKEPHVTEQRLHGWMRSILSGGRGSTVFLLVGRDRSLQVEIQPVEGENQLVLLYPKTAWSLPYFMEVAEMAKSRQLRMWQTRAGDKRHYETLWIAFGRNADEAATFSVWVITDVYGASIQNDCQAMIRKLTRFADSM